MTGATYLIGPEDPGTEDVRALLGAHLRFARGNSPPEDTHALDVTGLLDESISFFSCRRGSELLGVAALKLLTTEHAELKSMHTAAAARRQGVASALLTHLLAVAREEGCQRVSLETGSMAAFDAARALYSGAGFQPCPPFGAYRPSRNSTFMTLWLPPPA